MSVCRHELGGGSTTPPTPQPSGNSNPGRGHFAANLVLWSSSPRGTKGRIKTKLGLMLRCKQGRDWRQYSISIAIVWKHALSKGKLFGFQKILVCSHTGLFQEWAKCCSINGTHLNPARGTGSSGCKLQLHVRYRTTMPLPKPCPCTVYSAAAKRIIKKYSVYGIKIRIRLINFTLIMQL